MSTENTNVCDCGITHSQEFNDQRDKRKKLKQHVKSCDLNNCLQCTNASLIGISKE